MRATAQRQLFELTRIDWETPQALFDELNEEFGFVLDVCASHENAKCSSYFTMEVDGLRQPWGDYGVCWMNPPYGREISRWVAKAHHEAEYGATVVGLVPARTDTAWWHDHIQGKAEVRFLRGRIRFSGGGPAPFPSCIVVWRPTDA
jgi:phage N-6-adenine-methyltransferase